MKIFITLVVAVLLVVAAALFFGSGDLDIAAKPTPANAPGAAAAAASNQNFAPVSALLQGDMDKIPATLESPGVSPVNAFNVKSRLGGAQTARVEYQKLNQVCDLIIYADTEHSVRLMKVNEDQKLLIGDLMVNSATNQANMSSARTTLHTRAQAEWDAYRRQTDTEVRRLLGSLQNAKP